MKYVIAVIQPGKLDEVLERLTEKQIHLVTVSSARGRGRQQGITDGRRNRRKAGKLIEKVKLEIAVNDEYLKPTIDAISGAAHTGRIGDGKIFVLDLPDVVRIRTFERGRMAIG